MPESYYTGGISSLLSQANNEDPILFVDDDLINFNFDPLVNLQEQDTKRYQELLGLFDEASFRLTGNRLELSELPVVSRSINRTDPKDRDKNSDYFAVRDMVRDEARSSMEFRTGLPHYKQKEFVDQMTEEVYGLWATVGNMLPPVGTEEREEVGSAMMGILNADWSQRMGPFISRAASRHAVGWEGNPGEYGKTAVQQFKKTAALSMQSQSDLLGKLQTVGELFQGNAATVSALGGFEKTADILGGHIREQGRKEEMEADEIISTLAGPTGRYLESVGDMPSEMINPTYAWMKLIENAPNQLMTTGLSMAGGLAAGSMVATGWGATIGATLIGQLPGLLANFGLEAGDMYGSSRDYLNDLRDQAKSEKGRISKASHDSKYTYYVSEGITKSADKLSDDDIHNISKDLSTVYGLISTGIEGMTNVAGMARWLRGYGSVLSSGMATKEGKKIIGRHFAEKVGKLIRNFSQTKTVSALFAGGSEAIQEALQEGTGELMRARALPGYRFDSNVALDAAYSGLLFGKTTQGGIAALEYRKKKRLAKDLDKSIDGAQLLDREIGIAKGDMDDGDVEAVIKAGILKFDTDVKGIVDAITSDPAERGALERKIYALWETKEEWSDPEQLTNVLSGRSKTIKNVIGLTNEDLVESEIDFNEKHIADILGKTYTSSTEETLVDDSKDFMNEPADDPTQGVGDVTTGGKIDRFEAETREELKATVRMLNIMKESGPEAGQSEGDHQKTIRILEKDIALLEKDLNLFKESQPKPTQDKKASRKQSIIEKIKDTPGIVIRAKDRKIIKKMKRKNASEATIKEANDLVNKRVKEATLEGQKRKDAAETRVKDSATIHLKYDQLEKGLLDDMSDEIAQSSNAEDILDIEESYGEDLNALEQQRLLELQGLKGPIERIDELTKSVKDLTGEPKIVYGQTGKKHRSGEIIAASYNRDTNEITIDKDALQKKFDEKAWTKPQVKGVLKLQDNAFKTVEEFEQFVVEHELAHSKFPKKKGERKAQYENRMNKEALKVIAAGRKGVDKKELATKEEGTREVLPEAVHQVAEEMGVDIETEEFKKFSKTITGVSHIDDMSSSERTLLMAHLRAGEKPTPVMTDDDASTIGKNVTHIIDVEAFRDTQLTPEEVWELGENYPSELLGLARVKGVKNLERFTDMDGDLDFSKKEDIKIAILKAQGGATFTKGSVTMPFTRKSTKQRLHRWFDVVWRQASEKFGYEVDDFQNWSDTIGRNIPERYQGIWNEWAETVPAPRSEYDAIVNKFVGAIFKDTPTDFTQEEIDHAIDAIDSYGSKLNPVWEEHTDDSGGDVSFAEGWNRVNAIAFGPLGIYLDSSEASYIKKMVNLLPDFDAWVQEISKNVPLISGETIWEAAQDQATRLKLKQLYVGTLNRNITRINREAIDKKARVNLQFKYNEDTGTFDASIKGPDSTIKIGKLNSQWSRSMHGENYLGDIELIWAAGSDLLSEQIQRNAMGNPKTVGRWGRFKRAFKKRYGFFSEAELSVLSDTYFKDLKAIPLFVRGEEDQMALVKITQAHRDQAKNSKDYWNGEDLPKKMKDEYQVGDQFMKGANIARHEAMKQIFGPDYHVLSAQKIMQRIKAFFTPGVSVAGGPPSSVMVFDPTNVTFETTLRSGKKIVQKAMKMIDGKMQYIGDGNTITSERKFMFTYPKLLGTDPRAKRAKTIIGAHDETGVLIGKHQEMSMYVPIGAEMRIMDGKKTIALIKSNGETTDITVQGKYVDHLMTEDEAKIRLGNFDTKFGEVFEIPSEATTHVQAVGKPKTHANFPMQLMNYITDNVLQDAVSQMIINQTHEKSTKRLFQKIFDVSKSGEALDQFILSLKDRLDDAPPQFVTAAAELGAGRHPSNEGSASVLANSKYLKKAMSVLQNGSVLDFRPDYSNAVEDNEVMLPGSVPAIRKQVYQKYADANGITLKDAYSKNLSVVNAWLRENNVRVLMVRFPVPSGLGYGVFKVKGLMGTLGGDSFVVSPKVVKERFEGDHDHDTGHISFLDEDMLDLLESNQGPTQGINLEKYLPKDHDTQYSFSNINDVYKLMEELSFGSRAIGEIANAQRVAGVAQNHFEHMILDGKRVVQVSLDSVISDPNSGIQEETLGNIMRIYAQASFDNAKFRLLAKWDYSQKELFKLIFRNDDGTELTDRQFNTLKIYLDVLKMNGYVANSGNYDSRFTIKDTFNMSEQYYDFVNNREQFIAGKKITFMKNMKAETREKYATLDEVKLKSGNIHPHETLTMMPKHMADKHGIDTDRLFDIDGDQQRSKVVHNEATSNIVKDRAKDIADVAGDMSIQDRYNEATIGGDWANSMIKSLDKLYANHRKTTGGMSEVVSQTWDYNEEFTAFANLWYEGSDDIVGFKSLSPVAQRAATYDFLAGIRRRNEDTGVTHATYNTRMIPPVSKDGITLLDPVVMEKYFKEYNSLLENKFDDLTKINIPTKFSPIIKTSEEIKRLFGCA